MSDKSAVDRIITEFLRRTCRLKPSLTDRDVISSVCCMSMSVQLSLDDKFEPVLVPLTTGSVAELYIEPMLSCVGDIDIMFHHNSELAVPAGQSPPTQLPDEFNQHKLVRVLQIVDSEMPGYVYLDFCALLQESDDGKHKVFGCLESPNREPTYIASGSDLINDQLSIHGPARIYEDVVFKEVDLLSTDIVYCVRCLSWPSQAADWPTRHRCYNWPDSATVSRVVADGCDVVGVAHHKCREDEWKSKHQWRLSFSRAEIVLLNSWLSAQQIVYHVLRLFTKEEGLRDTPGNNESSHLSNYHIKTMMLWACELKPSSWWTEDISFVKICVELLHIIGDWLNDARYAHYFINNCNLIDSSFDFKDISSKVISIDEKWLSTWLVNNYMRRCSRLCPDNVSRSFANVSTITELQTAVSAVIACRFDNDMLSEWIALREAEMSVPLILSLPGYLTVRKYIHRFREFEKLDKRLCLCFVPFTFLHASHHISQQKAFDDLLMDVLATANIEPYAETRFHSQQCSSELHLSRATKLMKAVARRSLSTDQLIEIELSKAYLHRALRCEDSDSESIYCLVNVYLAVLYHTTGDCQTAIDYCSLATRSRDHLKCRSRVVQGELLPKPDDDINSAVGLATLYQYILTASLNQLQQPKYVRVFTTEVFTYYLHMRCQQETTGHQFTQTSFVENVQQYKQRLCSTQQLCVADVVLFKLQRQSSESSFPNRKPVRRKFGHSSINPTEFNPLELVELLRKSAVERLTEYRQVLSTDFKKSSVITVITTDFEALYEYKLGNYDQCLQVCSQNVRALLYGFVMPVVLTYPMFIQLFDDDLGSLIGMTLIVNPQCRGSRFYISITQLTLSMHLMTQCQLKLRHSVTSLAQTLKCIEAARKRLPSELILNHLTIKLTQRLAVRYLTKFSVGL